MPYGSLDLCLTNIDIHLVFNFSYDGANQSISLDREFSIGPR